MHTPELLLASLNCALRNLLGAAAVVGDEGLNDEILPVMRSLLLAEVLSESWIIAVGGSQSAGKTNLVRAMYSVGNENSWLSDNEGQGERLPVLVLEDRDVSAPQGYVRVLAESQQSKGDFAVVELPVAIAGFQKACRGSDPQVLLPVLRVPQRYFRHERQGLMLLPGYEKSTRDNKVWQALMREVLVGAAGTIIVTDETRLASQTQRDIAADMLQGELRNAKPLVVISKTETMVADPERLAQVRRSACEVFNLDPVADARQVLCTGTDDAAYVAQWLPKLAAALHDISVGGSERRQVQLVRLESVLSKDLTRLINRIRSASVIHFQAIEGGAGGNAAILEELLAHYDDAVSYLREDYRRALHLVLSTQLETATRELTGRLKSKHEGFINKLSALLDTYSETKEALENDIRASWPAQHVTQQAHGDVLAALTGELRGGMRGQPALADQSGNAMQRLGYVDDEGNAVASKLTDQSVHHDLAILLGKSNGDVEHAERTKHLEQSVALLPALMLEYTRLTVAVPVLSGMPDLPRADVMAAAKQVQEGFGQFSEVSKSLVKGIGLMLAVDFSVDGHIDTIPALLQALGLGTAAPAAGGTAAAAGIGATLATSVAGVAALGFVVHTALQQMRFHDGQVSAFAHAMLQNLRDHHEVHYLTHFDDMMRKLRSHLVRNMRQRLGLDQRLGERDRLGKALADVRMLQRDLLDALAGSGQTTDLFATGQAA